MYQTIYNITMNEVLKTHLKPLDLYLNQSKIHYSMSYLSNRDDY